MFNRFANPTGPGTHNSQGPNSKDYVANGRSVWEALLLDYIHKVYIAERPRASTVRPCRPECPNNTDYVGGASLSFCRLTGNLTRNARNGLCVQQCGLGRRMSLRCGLAGLRP